MAPPQASDGTEAAAARRGRRTWIGRLVLGVVFALLLVAAAIVALNTPVGRGLLAERVSSLRLASGLGVQIGRIDGSLYGRMTLHDVKLVDPHGPFLAAPTVRLDWRPLSLVRRRLDIRLLQSPQVRILRKPAFKAAPRRPDQPLLPNINLRLDALRLPRIDLDPAVTGRRHRATLRGAAAIENGRLHVEARADAVVAAQLAGGDRLRLNLDLTPKSNRLRIDFDLQAPADGLVAGYLGLKSRFAAGIAGRGDWANWTGRATAALGERTLADLDLSARAGRFAVKGILSPAPLLEAPTPAWLSAPMHVDAQARLDGKRLDGRLGLGSDVFNAQADGRLDLRANRMKDVRLSARLLRPGLLAPRLAGRDIRLSLDLNGRFSRPTVAYRLSATQLSLGDIGVETFKAEGRARVDVDRIEIPIAASARRVTGLDVAAGGELTDLALTGDLAWAGGRIVSDNLKLRSRRINATAVIVADLGKGQYAGALKGRVNDYRLRGVGQFGVETDARLTRGPGGGLGLTGWVRVTAQRLDNAAVRNLLGGRGVLTADLALLPNGDVTLGRLKLDAPDFHISEGAGVYRPNGAIGLRLAGRSNRYGPLGLVLGGTVTRPTGRLTAAAPGLGVAVRDVVLEVAGQTKQAYRATLRGQSAYGAFTGEATLDLAGPIAVDLSSFRLAGVGLSGRLAQTTAGPFAGALQVNGSGLTGQAKLSASADRQKVAIWLAARQATLPLSPAVTIGSGRLDATVVLAARGPEGQGDLILADVRRAGLRLAAARVRGRLSDGTGLVQATARGEGAVRFALAGQARLDGEAAVANIQGEVNGQSLRLAAPAHLARTPEGWRLSETRLILPGGDIVLSGQTGRQAKVSARLDKVDLSLVQAFAPELALEGLASGQLDAQLPAPGDAPSAQVRLEVRNFSRVGLATESPRVDLSLQGRLAPNGGRLDALIRRGPAEVGRLQARLGALPRARTLVDQVLAAPLSGGLRYNGPADVLWALTAIRGHELSGPVAIGADFGGRLSQPTLTGVLRADHLRYENTAYGTVLSDIALRGKFTQSRLEITSLKARAGSGGLSGSGWLGLDATAGFPMALQVDLQQAQLARSDALSAAVSGVLRIANDRAHGARIEGDLRIPEARYRFVRRGASEVAVLEGVRRRGSAPPPLVQAPSAGSFPATWTLDLRLHAPNRIFVSGLGLEAEWGADLRIKGSPAAPVVIGTLDLVRGAYVFAGRRLELTRAQIRFDGGQIADPLVDIRGETTVDGVTAVLNVGGRAQSPQISFTSTPALPQDEVLSRLLFGASIAQLSPTQAVQLAAAVNSLRGGGGGVDPLGRLRAATHVDRLRILGADAASGRQTALAAGAYLGRDLYLEVITDARGFTATQLQISLSRTLSLLLQASAASASSVELQYSKDY